MRSLSPGTVFSNLLIGLIKIYQVLVSPLSRPTCRFYPSCSHYSVTAIARFGPIKGTWLSLRRILRCNPWGGNGYDPVPPLAVDPAKPVDLLTQNTFNTDALLNQHLGTPTAPPSAISPPTQSES